LGWYLVDLVKVTSAAGVHKILADGVPEEIHFGVLVTFVRSKVSQFLMCVVDDLIHDIETIAISNRGNVDTISISLPFLIENSTQDLPLAFILSIAGPLNYIVVKWALCHSFPYGIMSFSFHVVLELIHVKVHSLVLGVLEGVIHIDRVHGLCNW
jgi:hypothetical protein